MKKSTIPALVISLIALSAETTHAADLRSYECSGWEDPAFSVLIADTSAQEADVRSFDNQGSFNGTFNRNEIQTLRDVVVNYTSQNSDAMTISLTLCNLDCSPGPIVGEFDYNGFKKTILCK